MVGKTPLSLASIGIVTSLIAFIINATANKKILKYGFGEQIKDIFPNLLISLLMSIIVYFVGKLNISLLPLICLQLIVGVIIYIVISLIFHNPSLYYCIDTLEGYTKVISKENCEHKN